MRLLTIPFGLFLFSGCASYGVIDNRRISQGGSAGSYAILTHL